MHVHLLAIPVQQGILGRGGQPGPGRVHAEPERRAQRLDQPDEVVADVPAAPRPDRAPGQRLARVGDNELRVDFQPGAQPGAIRARTPRRVKRERPRLQLLKRQVVIQARQVLGVHPLPVRVILRQVHEVQQHHPTRQAQRRLHRISQPPPRIRLDRQPVHHHLDRVLLALVQRRDAVQPGHGAVDPGPGVTLQLEFAEQFGVLALAAADDRGQHLEPGPLLQLQHPVHDLLRRLPRDRPPAQRAVRLPHPGIQQPQVVIHLRDRPHRGPRVTRRRLLVDRHRRGQPIDEIHIRLIHLPQELPRIRRQRLHIPPLPLRENRVKRQARLPRPRQPGKHDHGIPRQLQRHILQVVLTGTTDNDAFGHRLLFSARNSEQLHNNDRAALIPGWSPPPGWPGPPA